MRQFNRLQLRLINMLKIYRLLPVLCFFLLMLCGNRLIAQEGSKNIAEMIRDLEQGYLVIRLPGFKNKIDTLDAMIARTNEGTSKNRLITLRKEAIEERDKIREDYIEAFQNHYDFSKVAYFMDYDSRDLSTAHYYSLNGSEIPHSELSKVPLFYLLFERTKESKIDALVIYDRDMEFIPPPFPNNFSRGGFNLIFISITSGKYAAWRVKKLNKKLHKFRDQVN